MERTFPARALAVCGVTLVALTGPGTGPGTGAPSGSPARTDAAAAGSDHASVSRVSVEARSASARAASRRTTARWSGSIPVTHRAAVDTAYARAFASGLELGTGWTGSEAGCRAGTTSAASATATLRAVNFVRSMSGLAPVRLSATLNVRSQRTALMMSANRTLSHTPSRSWRCWSPSGAANAARSNLALSYPSITSAGLVELYMRDPGADNGAVGHRRWLLNPSTTTMGTGSTDTANAMTVIGSTANGRPNPTWVSWPTAGWFPSPLEPGGRWSLSAGDSRMDFRHATVRVTRNGRAVGVRKLGVHNGYGRPTLVWQLPATTASSGTFTVTVSGARVPGSRASFGRTYTVRLFTPTDG